MNGYLCSKEIRRNIISQPKSLSLRRQGFNTFLASLNVRQNKLERFKTSEHLEQSLIFMREAGAWLCRALLAVLVLELDSVFCFKY